MSKLFKEPNMRDFLGQPVNIGDRVIELNEYKMINTVKRFTAVMIVIERHNKTKTEKRTYARDVINIEANYKEYPELLL